MKPKNRLRLLLPLATLTSLAFAAHAPAAIILTDDFQTATTAGSVLNWTKIGTDLFGGIGTADFTIASTASRRAYFQTNTLNTAGMFRSSGTTGQAGNILTLTFDFGGKNNVEVYTGTFTASLWDGSPTGGGTMLASTVAANPAQNTVSAISLQHTLASNTTGNIFVQFNAGFAGPNSNINNGFQQPIIDNVSLDLNLIPEPSSALLGGLGLLALLRRRR